MDAVLWVAYLLECKCVNLNSNFDNRWSCENDTKQADICSGFILLIRNFCSWCSQYCISQQHTDQSYFMNYEKKSSICHFFLSNGKS